MPGAAGHPAPEMDVGIFGLPQLSPARTDLVDGHARRGDAVQHRPGRDHDDLRLLQGEPDDATRHAGPANPVVQLELRLVGRVELVVRRIGFDGGRWWWRELLSHA